MENLDLVKKIKQQEALTNEEKSYLIDLVNDKKKYGLVWENKPEDVEEKLKFKLPILAEVQEKQIVNDSESKSFPNHILIEGDNLHALSALSFTHEGRFDVIYIDPPYNTGARDWKYNNDYIDKSDPYRHTKWLSFMEKRLKIAKLLLADHGIICVTIDDNEVQRLWCLLEEIFDERNHLGTIAIRINPGGRKSKRKIALQHEFALFFAKDFDTKVAKVMRAPESKSHTYVQSDDGEWYEQRNLRKEGSDSLALKKNGTLSDRYYPIFYCPTTGEISVTQNLEVEILPIDSKGQKRIWRRGKDDIDGLFKSKDVFYKNTKYGPQIYFRFKGGLEGEAPKSFWEDTKYSASEHGTASLDELMDERESFPFPKSPHAVADCIKVASSKKNALILDFFAGSGTTLHSVISMNNNDHGTRRCVLVTNNENNICEEVTYKRVRRVITGHNQSTIPSLNNNLRYYKCGFLDRTPSIKNKKELTRLSTSLLSIKEDCYHEVEIKKQDWCKIFTNRAGLFLSVIYDDEKIEDSIIFIKQILEEYKPLNKVKVYVFSNGAYPYSEEFDEIIEKITLCALPDAIYKAYLNVLPKHSKTDDAKRIQENSEISMPPVNS